MKKAIGFGELKPDIPPNDQLTVAKNVYPTEVGYIPVQGFGALTPALAGISGGAAFISSTGQSSFLAGDATSLYRYSGSAWASLLGGLTAKRWRFAQFGDNVICVNGGAPVSYDQTLGTAALLAGSPPAGDLVTTVRDFVVIAGSPTRILDVAWSGFNNSTIWRSTTAQSDTQQMLDGGEVMGLAGGEYGIILQRNAIKRMTYVGPDVFFQFDEISSNVGCMAKGSVTQAGRLVFFLSERGFMLCDGNEARPIGTEKIDRSFFKTYSRQDIQNGIYAAVAPGRNIVYWSMPGTPGMLWCYHWTLDRWATIELDVRLVFSGFTANISIDALDALFTDIDHVPGSLDDPRYAGGNPLLLVASSAGIVGTLSGATLPATLTMARTELAPGDRVRVRTVRPITDATDVTVKLEGSARAGNLPFPEMSSDMRPNGDVPMRVNAQQIVATITLRGDWTYAQGLVFEFEAGGRR
jgi:hypothetical protein